MSERASRPNLTAGAPTWDPELLILPTPPRRSRAMTVGLLAASAGAAALMAFAIGGDVRYALEPQAPLDVGDLATVSSTGLRRNTFARARATLDGPRVVRYSRATEIDTFALVPVLGSDTWWVEMRLPRGTPTQTFNPPAMFVGRLLPMRAGLFDRGPAATAVGPTAPDAWVLVDGATPSGSRWTLPLAALLVAFIGYSLTAIARIMRPLPR